MDAFTQLLESYLSTNASEITDALAVEGLTKVSTSLLKAFEDGSDINARTGMSLAAYLSGITLANAGLGTVHGFASSVGGFFDIPHGVICSSLMPSCNKITVRQLRKTQTNNPALTKYATVGRIFAKESNKTDNYYIDYIVEMMEDWRLRMKIPRLANGGVSNKHFEKIASITDNKNNPIALGHDELIEALESAC
jgi:alcohol dehydrogenase class IV